MSGGVGRGARGVIMINHDDNALCDHNNKDTDKSYIYIFLDMLYIPNRTYLLHLLAQCLGNGMRIFGKKSGFRNVAAISTPCVHRQMGVRVPAKEESGGRVSVG